jgi:hypothetical protein
MGFEYPGTDGGEASVEAGETADGSDVTYYTIDNTSGTTVVDVTGSGVLLFAQAIEDSSSFSLDLTIDGGTTVSTGNFYHGSLGAYTAAAGAHRFEQSLTVEMSSQGGAIAAVKQ